MPNPNPTLFKNQWQWNINTTDGSITTLANSNLAISSSKEKDASLNSIYFALQNSRTQLAIGVNLSTDGCSNGMLLELQELAYGSPKQQFMYDKGTRKIVSLMCPDYAIEIPSDDCGATGGLHLSNVDQTDGRNRWSFVDGDSVIESVKCSGKYITLGGASNGGVRRMTTLPAAQFASGLPSAQPLDVGSSILSSSLMSNNIRYVKVSLSGQGLVLNFAEVEVFAMVNGVETDVAQSGTARQSSTYGPFTAEKAIDGNKAGTTASRDIIHTNQQADPWWMVELDQSYVISRIVVWNRRDCCGARLNGALVALLDSNQNSIKQFVIGHATNENVIDVPADEGLPSAPSSDNNTQTEDETYTPADNSTSTLEWVDNTPPDVGSSIVLASLNSKRYQKWTKEHQLFHPLMGPFSIVNPINRLAIAVADGVCSNRMALQSQTDDHTKRTQMFYLGQHGSIFSAACPGLVITTDSTSSTDGAFDPTIKLQTIQTRKHKEENSHLKWKFSNGRIESVMHQSMVIGGYLNGVLTLEDKTSSPSQIWKRVNTRVLDLDGDQTTEWKQKWTVSFVAPDYGNATLDELASLSEGNSITWYQPSPAPAFCASFEDFAKELVIEDASDEDQCRHTREQLGFDKDHP